MIDGKNLPEIPQSWIWVKFYEILEVGQGGTPSTAIPEYWNGSIPWLRSGEIRFNRIKESKETISESGLRNSPARLLPKGTVLLAMTGQGLTRGRAAILDTDASGNQSCAHLIPEKNAIRSEFLFYYFRAEYWKVRSFDKGSNQPGLNTAIIKEFTLPLPPLPEQHRIVTKIDELLTQLDAGVASLKKAQVQLKRYRQAVLKAAFEGRLTQEWREEHKGKIEPADVLLKRIQEERQRLAGSILDNSPGIDTSDLPSLPNGWIWCRLPELSWDAGYGTSVKCDYGYYGYPVLRIPNIVKGTIDLSDLKYAPKTENNNLNEFVDVGDLLIIRTNGSKDIVGKSALVKSRYDGNHAFASYLIRYRFVNNETLQNWISIIWYSPYIRKSIMDLATTTAGQYNVSLSKLNTLVFPLPPQLEQQYIISEVERCFSIADEIENTITTSLLQSETLRQSILKQAFEGKIVPQDPNDEPASVLLERIKAGKARHAAETKNGKTLQPKSPKRKIKNAN